MEVHSCNTYPNDKLLQLEYIVKNGEVFSVVIPTLTISFYNLSAEKPVDENVKL